MIANQDGVLCSVGIFKTSSEKSLAMAELFFEQFKLFASNQNDWTDICKKCVGFLGDQANNAQKLNQDLGELLNKVVPAPRTHLTCFMHFT